ncbi:MAG: MFS transporter [Clostridia bacterium]|nr:MFS transporter [Clostridia bacterium]
MKLNYKRTILIGFAFMAILAFWQFYDQVIPYLLEYRYGLKTDVANLIMSIDNILAVFMLPLFGALSDKTHTKLGKRTPYILFGGLGSVILLVLLGITNEIGKFPMFFIVLVVLLVVMAVYRSPAVAYMPDVTEKPLRSKANAIINLVGYIGGIFATGVMMFMLKSNKQADGSKVYDENQSFLPVFIVIAAFMAIAIIVLVLTTKENKIPHVVDAPDENEEKGKGVKLEKGVRTSMILILLSVFLWYAAYNAVTTAFSRYCVEIWGADLGTSSSYLLVATVTAIAAFVPLGFLSSVLGRKKMVLLGITLMTVCYAIAIFLTKQTPIAYVLFAVVGIGWASINVNSFPMVVEMCKGGDVGKYTGYYYTFSMAAQIVTPLLSGLLITHIPTHYRVLFPYAVIFSVLSFVTMLFVRHGDSKPQKKKSVIENFDSDI